MINSWIRLPLCVLAILATSLAQGQSEPQSDPALTQPRTPIATEKETNSAAGDVAGSTPSAGPSSESADKTTTENLTKQLQQLRHQGKFAEAIPLAEIVLSIHKKTRDDSWWEVADAKRLLELLRRAAAFPPNVQAELAEADRTDSQVEQLYLEGKYDEAIRLTVLQLEVRKKILGNEHPDVATSLNNLAALASAKGDFPGALEQLRRTLDLRRKILGNEHPDVAESLNNLGFMFLQLGNFSLAKSTCEEAFRLYQRLVGDCEATASSLNNVAEALQNMGRYKSAEPLYREVLAIRRKIHTGDHQLVAHAISNLALNYDAKGDYESADPLFREALGMLRRTVGEENPDVATLINNVAHSASVQGKYGIAESLFREALALRVKLLGPEHPDTSVVMTNLARTLHVKGDYPAAEATYKQALQIQEKTLGNVHPDVALTLNDLAVLYRERGDYASAQSMYAEAISIQRQLGDMHPDLSMTRCNLASLLDAQGKLSEAETLYRDALSARRDSLGIAHPDVARSMENLASLLTRKGHPDSFSEADSLYQQAVQILRACHDPYLHVALTNYASFLLRQRNQPSDAMQLFEEAIEQIEHLRLQVGGDELDRARFFTVLQQADAFGGAIRAQLAIADSSPGAPAAALTYLERGRGRALLDLVDRGADDLYSFALDHAKHEDNEKLRSKVESIKKREIDAREELFAFEKKIRFIRADSSIDAEERATRLSQNVKARDEASDIQRQAARDLFQLIANELPLYGLAPLDTAHIAAGLKPGEILFAYDVGEKDSVLLALLPDGRVQSFLLAWPDGTPLNTASLKDSVDATLSLFAHNMSPSSNAVATIHRHTAADLFETLIPRGVRQSVADAKRLFIIGDDALHRLPFEALPTSEPSHARSLDLFPAVSYSPSATLLLTNRARVRTSQHPASQMIIALGDAIYSRDEPVARTGKSTAGPNHGVFLDEVLPAANAAKNGLHVGDVLLAYNGAKITGPEELVTAISTVTATSTQEPTPPKEIPVEVWRNGETIHLTVAPGALGIQLSPLKVAEALRVSRELGLTDDQRYVAVVASATRVGFGTLSSLPGTRAEIAALTTLMHKSGIDSRSITALTGEDATLTNLFRVVDRPRFLHLATHGLADGGARVYESSLALTLPKEPTPQDDGFLRLGDLLSKWGGKLHGTELVVLSACNTAGGPVESGDGVIALTWGFVSAGAQSVLASLWSVDDRATTLLMTRFYENLLGVFEMPRQGYPAGQPMPKTEALREAKQWLRTLRVSDLGKTVATDRGSPIPAIRDLGTLSDRPFDDPYYWAAFILMGDPD